MLIGLADVAAGAERPRSHDRPNIVVLMTDDQTVESLRVMEVVQQRLVAQGTTFESSFVGFALCCPSRATFLTGQYAHNHGVMHNVPPLGGYARLDHTSTLPVWLQRAGYFTAHVGKYLNGYGTEKLTEVPPGWSEWYGSLDVRGDYSYQGFTLNENGGLVRYPSRPDLYRTDVEAKLAADLIRRRARDKTPFFLSVAFLAPHAGTPIEPDDPAEPVAGTPAAAERHRDRFAGEPLPMPPSFNEADMSDKPAGARARPLMSPATIAALREKYQQRLESLLAVDEAVGRILAALAETGELDSTVVLFTSDNGYILGEHRIPSDKVWPYEPAIRVPLVIRGPGFPAGRVVKQLVSNVDLAPTILGLAGVRPGRLMDGRSLLPLVVDPRLEWGRDLLVETFAPTWALRTPWFLYVEHGSGESELYDLRTDPDQLASISGDPAHAAIRAQLAHRLRLLLACAGRMCRTPPDLRLELERRGCGAPAVRASVRGKDLAWVRQVTWYLNGRRLSTDASRPFRRRVGSGPGRELRASVQLVDRAVTLDRRVPNCR